MLDNTNTFAEKVEQWELILDENFSRYATGDFSEGYTAVCEFHFPEKKIDQGEWEEISSHHLWDPSRNDDFPNWKICLEDGQKRLKQTLANRMNRKNWKYPIKKLFLKSRLQLLLAMPALATGDSNWSDYGFRTEVRPLAKDDFCGLLFRGLDGQRHYQFGVKDGKALLMKREWNELRSLRVGNCEYGWDRYISLSVIVEGDHIRCFADDKCIFEATDEGYRNGKVGLISNVPALFRRAEIYMPKEVLKSSTIVRKKVDEDSKAFQEKFPRAELWKKISIPNFCSGRSLRFGDLTGNGNCDILIAKGKILKPDHCAITCLTAVDQDGRVLWQKGTLTPDMECLPCDLPFQVYDIDGDGLNEVVCAMDFEIQILDGRTGEVKAKRPTPKSTTPQNQFDQILGDCFYFANLSGGARPQEILFKDRYSKIYAYDNRLELLWEHECNTGHYPFTFDPDQSGREKVLVGYTLLDADGKKIWNLPLQDHADAVAAVKFPGQSEYAVIIAASDEGLIFADLSGKIKKHLRMGHLQTVTIADLMGDSSGVQIATNTFWGNPGNIYVFDEKAKILSSFQPSLYGSPLYPVNWTGDGQRLLLLSGANGPKGGLYDGLGRQAVNFPKDGHPYLCCEAIDMTGDPRDEIVCWDFENLWIYTQSDSGSSSISRVRPVRPAPFNASNYRSNIAL